MSRNTDLTAFPSSEKRRALALALQTIAAVLPVGNAASALITALMPELSKDRIAWLEYLASSVLQQEGRIRIQEDHVQTLEREMEEFAQRPAFRAAVLRTTDIALRDATHRKWKALSNIVVQNMLPDPPDDDLQLMFLDYIDTFGTWHLYLLKFFDIPRVWPISIAESSIGQVGQLGRAVVPFNVIKREFPELAQKQAFCMQGIADLVNRGLITLDASKLDYSDAWDLGDGHPPSARLTTTLGQAFLRLITDGKSVSDAGDESQ